MCCGDKRSALKAEQKTSAKKQQEKRREPRPAPPPVPRGGSGVSYVR
jgi:hypothetical protein